MSNAILFCASSAHSFAQENEARQRARAVRDLAKQGADAIPLIAPYMTDADAQVRVEAVKAYVDLGGPRTLDPLVKAAGDNDAEVQIRATDGLVNVYLPGYVKTGLSGTLSRAGNSIRVKFSETNDQVIDPFVTVRPDVVIALGKLARGASSLDARANAARAVGVLRGKEALPDLYEALRSKDSKLMYESLVAIEKIADPSSASRIAFVLRDLDERVKTQALEVTGILRNKDAAPQVREALRDASTPKVKRAALEALAKLADPADHAIFIQNLNDKDEGVRAAASEGLGRIRNPMDRMILEQNFNGERAMLPRLAAAFALVSSGDATTERYGPLRYLFNALNQRNWRDTAGPYLTELAREKRTRDIMRQLLEGGTKDERIQIAPVFASTGDRDFVAVLEALSKDPDPDVAAAGIRSLRVLRTSIQ